LLLVAEVAAAALMLHGMVAAAVVLVDCYQETQLLLVERFTQLPLAVVVAVVLEQIVPHPLAQTVEILLLLDLLLLAVVLVVAAHKVVLATEFLEVLVEAELTVLARQAAALERPDKEMLEAVGQLLVGLADLHMEVVVVALVALVKTVIHTGLQIR
jgi:hypothetical protein